MFKQIKWRWRFFVDFFNLSRCKNKIEFNRYALTHDERIAIEDIVKNRSPDENARRTGRNDYIALLDFLNLNVYDKDVLELGPGWGDFLDLAKERGSHSTSFVDYHPYYFHYCRLNGHQGYKNDYFSNGAFKNVPKRRYDLILSKGSINADRFERQFDGGFRKISFSKWLDRLEDLARPNAMVIICPTYDLGFDMSKPYAYTDYPFGRRHMFEYLISCGYQIYTDIKGFSHKDYFPFTFVKKVKKF